MERIIIILVVVLAATIGIVVLRDMIFDVKEYYATIRKGNRYVWRIPKMVGPRYGTVKIGLTERHLQIDRRGRSGITKLFGFFYILPHWTSYRVGIRVLKNRVDITTYAYVRGKSPQKDNTLKHTLLSFDKRKLFTYFENNRLLQIPIFISESVDHTIMLVTASDKDKLMGLFGYNGAEGINAYHSIPNPTSNCYRWLRFESLPFVEYKQKFDLETYINSDDL